MTPQCVCSNNSDLDKCSSVHTRLNSLHIAPVQTEIHDICCRLKLGSSFRPAYLLKPRFKKSGCRFKLDEMRAQCPCANITSDMCCRTRAVLSTSAVEFKLFSDTCCCFSDTVKTRKLRIESAQTTIYDTWPLFQAGGTTCAISPLKHPFRQVLSYSSCSSDMCSRTPVALPTSVVVSRAHLSSGENARVAQRVSSNHTTRHVVVGSNSTNSLHSAPVQTDMHDRCNVVSNRAQVFDNEFLLKPLLKNVAVVSNGGTTCAAFPLKHFFTTCGCRSQAGLPTRAVVLKPLFRRALTFLDPMFLLVETRGLRGVPAQTSALKTKGFS